MRQQTGWPIMVCHGCGKEYSTRNATCSRCRIVTRKCKCPAINTKAHSQQKRSKNWLQHIIDNTKQKGDIKHSQPTLQQPRRPGCNSFLQPQTRSRMGVCKKQFRIRRRDKPRQTGDVHHREDKSAFETFTRRAWLECFFQLFSLTWCVMEFITRLIHALYTQNTSDHVSSTCWPPRNQRPGGSMPSEPKRKGSWMKGTMMDEV